ncbi:MAG: hypothetical protein EBX40_07415, partial [Gammaproteobacteria bacterium]|nr:hypothetical protein [Gammaproteobacteria bacterium]
EEAIEAGKPSIGRQKTSDIAKRLREAANSLMYLDRASCPAARRTLGAEPFLGTEDLAVLFGGAVESYRCPTVGEVLERVHARARQLNVSIQLFEENTEKMMSSLRPAGRYTVTCNFSPKPAPVVLFFNCPRFSIEMSSTPDERGYLGQDLEWLKKTALLKWVTAGWALLLKGANPSLDAYARAFCHWSFELFPFGLDLGTALGGDKVTSSHFNVDEILKRTLRIPGVDLELPGAEARTNREGFLLGVLIEQLPGAIETLERAVNSYISDRSSSDLNGPWLSPELLDILQLGGQVYSTSESSYDLFRTETPPTVRQVLDELMKRIDKVVVDPTVSIGVEFKKIGSDGMPTVSQDAIFKRPEKVVSPVPVSATATVLRPAQAVGATARVANSAGVSVGDALILNRSRAALFCSDHSGFNPWDKL